MSTSSSDAELIARPRPKKRVKQSIHSIEALPLAVSYTRSYKGLRVVCLAVHRETGYTALATSSGILELRQQRDGELQLVRRLEAAFCDRIEHMRFSCDGSLLAIAGSNGALATIDTQTADIIAVRSDTPSNHEQMYVAWLGNTLVAAAGCHAWLFDQALESSQKLPNLHKRTISGVEHSKRHQCIVSWDELGIIEVWDKHGQLPETVRYKTKSETDLFLFRKDKRRIQNISVARDALVVLDTDGRLVVFDFVSGKRKREYDETLETVEEMQKLGTGVVIDPVEFSRRVKTESKENDMLAIDVSSTIVVYPTILGIKALSLRTSTVAKVYGLADSIRFHQLGLVQYRSRQHTLETAAAESSIVDRQTKVDSAIIALDAEGDIYLFGQEVKTPRDVDLTVASVDPEPVEPVKIV
ncbi:Peptidyl-prolyl cis-trans isomerase cyp15 [Wickerhamiella sorbophila]|uniref:Peptidyl-prolyl cis-trans isomerase cyp15 n=1 Tax=Wickerhamiella sorbophila TaxID=45607 RepID=A0A2T0FFR8_9ASCO|nr:Peptidyl-prolyl cis-trans isomerase cyp15 [Wickerhamiella sorbophila]PRT53824.1 Peptidyl-prolyl cis-trans isomerase cyp15 [Wickerhamiella sorbophila]